MSKASRILVITPFLWSGAGKAIVRLIRDLRPKGFDFEIISSGKSRGQSDWPEYVQLLREMEIPYHTIDFFDRTPEVLWENINKLTDFIRSRKIHMIHVHAGVPAFAAIVARDRLGARFPIAATFHSWNPARPVWMNHADIWALNRCDRVITDSHSYQTQLQDWGLNAKNSEPIRLGIDMPEDSAAGGVRKGRAFQILNVGRLEPRKDQMTLLHGFSLFRKKYPQSNLTLAGPVGDEEYARRLRQKANQCGWERGVRFLGKVRDLDPLYRKSDLFVSTSKDEGLGLAVLEAMSYGLPVICTPVAGHSDFVEDGDNAWLIPAGKPKSLARSIQELYDNPEMRTRLGESARRIVASRFSWAYTTERYADIFKTLLAKYSDMP
jgi:glycosyltransferase involved in cell wall biosynthesis